eukprot:PhF_6_TR15910/c0_g1_i5/m.24568
MMKFVLLFVLCTAATVSLGARVYKDKKAYHGYHVLSNVPGFYPSNTDHCLPKGHHHVRTLHHKTPEGQSVKLHYNVSFQKKFNFAVIDGPIHSMICGKKQKHVLVRFETPEGASVFMRELSVANVVSSFPPHQCQDSNVVSMLLRRVELHTDNITVVMYGGPITPFDVIATAHVEFETDMLHGTMIPFAHGEPKQPNNNSNSTKTETEHSTSQNHHRHLQEAQPFNMKEQTQKWFDDPFGTSSAFRDSEFKEGFEKAKKKAKEKAKEAKEAAYEVVEALPIDEVQSAMEVMKPDDSRFKYNAYLNLDILYKWQPTTPTEFQESLAKLEKGTAEEKLNKKSSQRDSLSKAMEAGIWEWNVDILNDVAKQAPYQKEAKEMVDAFAKSFTDFLSLVNSASEVIKPKISLTTRIKVQPKLKFAFKYNEDKPTGATSNVETFELWVTFFYLAKLFLEIQFFAKQESQKVFTLFELAPICIPIPLGPVSLSLCPTAAIKLEWNLLVKAEFTKKYTWGIHGFKSFGWRPEFKTTGPNFDLSPDDSFMMGVPIGYEAYLGRPCKKSSLKALVSTQKTVDDCARQCHSAAVNSDHEKCRGFAFRRDKSAGNCILSESSGEQCDQSKGPGVNAITTALVDKGPAKLIIGSGNGEIRILDPAALSNTATSNVLLSPNVISGMVKSLLTVGNRYVLAAGWDPNIRILDAQDPTTKGSLKHLSTTVITPTDCTLKSYTDLEAECQPKCPKTCVSFLRTDQGTPPRCICNGGAIGGGMCSDSTFYPGCAKFAPPFTSLTVIDYQSKLRLFAGDSIGNVWYVAIKQSEFGSSLQLKMKAIRLPSLNQINCLLSVPRNNGIHLLVGTETGLGEKFFASENDLNTFIDSAKHVWVGETSPVRCMTMWIDTVTTGKQTSNSAIILTGHSDGMIFAWKTLSGIDQMRATKFEGMSIASRSNKASRFYPAHNDAVTSLASVTYQNSWVVVSGGGDGSVNIWGMTPYGTLESSYFTATLLNTYQKHGGAVTGITLLQVTKTNGFSGLSISTVSTDGTIVSFEDAPKKADVGMALEVPTGAAYSSIGLSPFLILNGGNDFLIPFSDFTFAVKQGITNKMTTTANCKNGKTSCKSNECQCVYMAPFNVQQIKSVSANSYDNKPQTVAAVGQMDKVCKVTAIDVAFADQSKSTDSSVTGPVDEPCAFVSVAPNGQYVVMATTLNIHVGEMVPNVNQIRVLKPPGTKIHGGETSSLSTVPKTFTGDIVCGGFAIRKDKNPKDAYLLFGTKTGSTGQKDNKLRIVGVSKATIGKVFLEIDVDEQLQVCSFSPDGRYVNALTTTGNLIWWDAVSTAKSSWNTVNVKSVFQTLTPANTEAIIKSFAVSPDNSRVAFAVNACCKQVTIVTSRGQESVEYQGRVHIWCVETQQVIFTYKFDDPDNERAAYVSYSPDGKWLAANSDKIDVKTSYKFYEWDSFGFFQVVVNTASTSFTDPFTYGDLGVGYATNYVFFDKK